MIASFTLALMLQAASAEESPVWLAYVTLHAKHLTEAELAVARHYASCISMPNFPMPPEFAVKRQNCRTSASVRNQSGKLLNVLDSLDALVRDHPGSEATLKVIKE